MCVCNISLFSLGTRRNHEGITKESPGRVRCQHRPNHPRSTLPPHHHHHRNFRQSSLCPPPFSSSSMPCRFLQGHLSMHLPRVAGNLPALGSSGHSKQGTSYFIHKSEREGGTATWREGQGWCRVHRGGGLHRDAHRLWPYIASYIPAGVALG